MRQCFLGKAGRTSRIVRKDLFLTGSDALIDLGPIGIRVRGRQALGIHVGNGVVSKLFEVEYFLQIRQDCHKIVPMGIPSGVGRFHVQSTRHGIDMRIVNIGGESNFGMGIDIVVLFGKSDLEFENSIRKGSSSDENDSVKVAQIVEGGYQIDPTGSMLFKMFVFNGYFVVTKGLFAFFL